MTLLSTMQRFKKYIEEDTSFYDHDGPRDYSSIDTLNITKEDIEYLSIIDYKWRIHYRIIMKSGLSYDTEVFEYSPICIFLDELLEHKNSIECLLITSGSTKYSLNKNLDSIRYIVVLITDGAFVFNKSIIDKLYIHARQCGFFLWRYHEYEHNYAIKFNGNFTTEAVDENFVRSNKLARHTIGIDMKDIDIMYVLFSKYDMIREYYEKHKNNIEGIKLLHVPDDIKSAIIEYF